RSHGWLGGMTGRRDHGDDAPRSAPVTDAATSARMSRQRRAHTAPELALRRELHRAGLRYFVDRAPIKGQRRRADVVFPRRRVAVYVDGCFWHRCPEHATDPKNNAEWWAQKLAGYRCRVDRGGLAGGAGVGTRGPAGRRPADRRVGSRNWLIGVRPSPENAR
ncbi:hypothetical protein ACFXOQ_37625, partial [Streptomyces californicus]|uniref:hypothetical protein n=1 Tax=Streptomyces californicus TaxID=67351 RepID=UPI0036B3F19A